MQTRRAQSYLLLSLATLAASPFAAAVESQSVDDIVGFLESQSTTEYTSSQYGNLLIVTAPASEDRALYSHLLGKVTFEFEDTPIEDVANFIRQTGRMNVVCAPGVLASNKTVTLKADDMLLGHAVRWIAKVTEFNFGFVDGALYISDSQIERPSQTRIYDLSDMVMPIEDFPGPEIALFEKPFGK